MNAKERKRLQELERKKGMIELLKKIKGKEDTAKAPLPMLNSCSEAIDNNWLRLGCFKKD
jgi:hypothetical protein